MADDQYLARARLERSLKVEAAILKKREEDWAILFAEKYELKGIKINGKGLIAWEVETNDAEEIKEDCGTSKLLSRISTSKILTNQTKKWTDKNKTKQ